VKPTVTPQISSANRTTLVRPDLAPRQLEVLLAYVATNAVQAAVARSLGIDTETLKRHQRRIRAEYADAGGRPRPAATCTCALERLPAATDTPPWGVGAESSRQLRRRRRRAWQAARIVLPVETTIDSLGRVVPKALREALGLTPGTRVDVSRYGAGLQLVPAGRTARLVETDEALVADSTTPVTDEDVFGLLNADRR
jgi:AbrB family looped-hinge helix DNA binding protein